MCIGAPRFRVQINLMKPRPLVFLSAFFFTCGLGPVRAANDGFETGLRGWRDLWTREPGRGALTLDRSTAHGGSVSVKIEHHGQRDWSFEPTDRQAVKPGDIFRLEAWVKADMGEGSVTLCATLLDEKGEAVDWSHGSRTTTRTAGWRRLESRFVIPEGVARMTPRMIGMGPLTVWLDDFKFEREGSLADLRPPDLPEALSVSNAALQVSLRTRDATLSVLDRRTGVTTTQVVDSRECLLTGASIESGAIRFKLLAIESGRDLAGIIGLDPERAEFTVEIKGEGSLDAPLHFPQPFHSRKGEYLVVPMNEGISYPVDDDSIHPMKLIAYGGHGICMAFWGVTDGGRGRMAILETPDDAAIELRRIDGLLDIRPEWQAQRGQFGYARRLRYVFFDRGGHVAIAKRYREHARKTGLFKTLAEKRKKNPNVDRLIGAVNVWCWDRDSVEIVTEMQAAGIDRILWSNRQSPEKLAVLNALGVLTSRYDIYQDVMDPANFPRLHGVHGDWTTAAWPKDIVIDRAGAWLHGWGVKGKEGEWFHCGVICDKRAPDYALARIGEELKTHSYRCRFIDTTTAAPWHECYSPEHPMTRTESKRWKMELLRQVSETHKLVTGCETGHDASVPFLHYFEGMMSLGPYRVPDAGRDMARIWTEVPERVAKFQLGHRYRLPLWELVYHDCVVAQWYWGDYNNKLPALWNKRDQFNALYATPPMFMFNRGQWRENRERFIRSYHDTCSTVRRVGYSEMTDHRFLTDDRDVQQSRFANGVTVTVNFDDKARELPDGSTMGAGVIKVVDR